MFLIFIFMLKTRMKLETEKRKYARSAATTMVDSRWRTTRRSALSALLLTFSVFGETAQNVQFGHI